MGKEFQELLTSYGIEDTSPTTLKNPQANGMVEKMHLSMGDMIRTSKFESDTWEEEVDLLLQSIAWAIRSTVHSTALYTPGQLVFQRDMVVPLTVRIDWAKIVRQRQSARIRSNGQENQNRLEHKYKVGDKVLLIVKPADRKYKLSPPTEGPFRVLKVFDNGTIRIRRGNYNETISIRRVKPFFG